MAKDEVKPRQKEKNKAKKIDEQQLEKDRVLAARIAQAQLERETMLAIPMVCRYLIVENSGFIGSRDGARLARRQVHSSK